VFFDPVCENEGMTIAQTKEIELQQDSEHEEPEQDHRTSSEIKSGLPSKINTGRKFDIKQLKVEIWKILEPKIPAYYRDAATGLHDFRIYL